MGSRAARQAGNCLAKRRRLSPAKARRLRPGRDWDVQNTAPKGGVNLSTGIVALAPHLSSGALHHADLLRKIITWHSPAKGVGGQTPPRGFESLPLRHSPNKSCGYECSRQLPRERSCRRQCARTCSELRAYVAQIWHSRIRYMFRSSSPTLLWVGRLAREYVVCCRYHPGLGCIDADQGQKA